MGKNPINLALRFVLELIALIAIGAWAKAQFSGAISFIPMIITPLIFAVIWGVFNVPGDPSRSGKAPVRVPGIVRLLIEIDILALAAWALFTFNPTYGWIFGIVVLVHYVLSYDRIAWLLKN